MYSRTIEKEKDMLVSDVYIYIQKPIYEMHAHTHALLFKRIFCTMIQWYNGIRRASVFYCYGYYLSLSACDDDEDDDERNAKLCAANFLFICLIILCVCVFLCFSLCVSTNVFEKLNTNVDKNMQQSKREWASEQASEIHMNALMLLCESDSEMAWGEMVILAAMYRIFF